MTEPDDRMQELESRLAALEAEITAGRLVRRVDRDVHRAARVERHRAAVRVLQHERVATLAADDSRRGAIVFCASAAPSADSRHTTGLQHLAFMVDTRAQVDAVGDPVAGLGARASDSV